MANPLEKLLALPEAEKAERGLAHTPREIWQQPETWKQTYQLCRERAGELRGVLDRAGIGRVPGPVVYLVGAGTSDYAGRALVELLRERWNCDVWAVPSTTLLTDFDAYHRADRKYLWISISRSGDSPEGVALLQRALELHPQIRHLVITCNQHGHMARLCSRHADRASDLVLDDAVNDRGVAMTSSFTNLVLAGQCLANLENLDAFGAAVDAMADAGSVLVPAAAEMADLIVRRGLSRACFVGSGPLAAVADECALKLLELTAGKITTLAQTPLGLRHGPMSSLNDDTLLVLFLSSDSQRRGYEVDLLRDLSRKGLGKIRVLVGAHGGEDFASHADFRLPVNVPADFPDTCRPVLDVILGQLLGLFGSMQCGLQPDQPSPNGAITRVVEPIRLYR